MAEEIEQEQQPALQRTCPAAAVGHRHPDLGSIVPPCPRSRTEHYSNGFCADTIDPSDYIFVPDHPEWYGWYLLPNEVDLRDTDLLVVLNQGGVGSCTANAAAAAMQYTIRRFSDGQRSFEAR